MIRTLLARARAAVDNPGPVSALVGLAAVLAGGYVVQRHVALQRVALITAWQQLQTIARDNDAIGEHLAKVATPDADPHPDATPGFAAAVDELADELAKTPMIGDPR